MEDDLAVVELTRAFCRTTESRDRQRDTRIQLIIAVTQIQFDMSFHVFFLLM